MKRAELIESLTRHGVYDLAVVGGGATGLGVALDAALRGFSVVLLESHDFAGGTSSRSTKLLHGGVRYLAQGNLSLVREALAERATVLRIAPHLAQPLPFVMPSYRWWQTPFYGLGLKLYDLLAGAAGLGRTEFLSRADTLQALPGVNPDGLRGGVKYWDGQFDDARLALALARSAEAAGARVLNYAEVTGVRQVSGGDHALSTLDVRDRRADAAFQLQARCVVNATGVWVDALRDRSQPSTAQGAPSRMVSPSQGVHVVVDRDFMPGGHALLVPKTRDGRVLFAVPWLGKLVLGTTDTPRRDLPREPDAFAEELEFILSEASQALSRPVRREDIRSLWVGLRPLVAAPEAAEGGNHLIGDIKPKAATTTGELVEINQHQLSKAATTTLAKTGYLYIPQHCAGGEPCQLHVSFHGCRQNADNVGDAYVTGTGLNNYADTNNIVIVYPQTQASNINPFNPNACWDWWGYTGADYATKEGMQLKAIHQLVQALITD